MDLDSTVIVLVSLWLAVLTLLVLMLVRQVGLITVRLDRDRRASAAVNDGLKVNEPLPSAMAHLMSVDEQGVGYILILGAVCAPCRELASDLKGAVIERPVTALVSGSAELGDALEDMLPSAISVVRDTPEGDLAKSLRIETTPFVFEVGNNVIRGKAVLRGAEHLLSFINSHDKNTNGAALQLQEVNAHAKP